MTKRRKFLTLLCVALAGGILYIGCYLMVTSAFDIHTTQVVTEEVSDAQLSACSKLMHLTFPKTTRPLGLSAIGGWLDDSVLLKIELSRDELQEFIDASPFAGRELGRDQMRVYGRADLPWWNIDDLHEYEWKAGQEAFISDEAWLPDAEALLILMDIRRQDVVVVYLEWFET